MRLPAVLMLSFLLLPGVADAKKMKAMTDAEILEILASSPDEALRDEAAAMLGDRGSREAIPALTKAAMEETSLAVQLEAIDSLHDLRVLDPIQAIFETEGHDEKVYAKALAILMKEDAPRADAAVPYHLSRYRSHTPSFTMSLLRAVVRLNRQDARDLALVVVTDVGQKRKVRVKALEVMETLKHPGLTQAYLALVTDDDKKIKIRCIEGLTRTGLDGDQVTAALSDVARSDKQGDVRAKAMRALKNYTHPGLLPLVHDRIANEKHLVAWGHAAEMLLVLADPTSVPVITRLMNPEVNLPDAYRIELINTLVRLGDPSCVPALQVLADAMIEADQANVRNAALRAIELLSPAKEQERIVFVQAWAPPVEVVIWEVGATVVETYEMSVSVDASGMVVGADGAAFSLSSSVSIDGSP